MAVDVANKGGVDDDERLGTEEGACQVMESVVVTE